MSALLSWIVSTTATGVVVKSASDQLEKGTSSLGGSLNFAMGKLPYLLTSQFVVGILTTIGLLLLIIPGIIVGITLGIANVVTIPLTIIHPIINPITTYVISAFLLPIYPIALTYLHYSMVARENPPQTP